MSKEERDIKVNEIIKTIEASDLPQIILDSFKDNFSKYFFNLNITNEELIKRATDCYEKNSILINKLPQDVATNFIYDYCTKFEEHKEIVESYTYYKGFKDIFYLLHGYGMSGVFILFNGLSLKKDADKYISDYSWGYIDISDSDILGDKKVSANTTQTADVILRAIYPNDEDKLNLIPLFIDTFLIENTTYNDNSSFSKEDVLNWYENLNLIKKVCLEQKLTYREFGEQVGFGEGAIKNAAASGKISDQLTRATEMFLEIQELRKENLKFRKLQSLMKEIVSL